MATVTLKGDAIHTNGELPAVGSAAPDFNLVTKDLADVTLATYKGKKKILSIVPSLDTSVCAASTKKFNDYAKGRDDLVVLTISADLPFAHARFCEGEGLDRVIPLSVFRSPDFGKDYGVTIADGPIAGLLSRAIVIIDENGKVIYTEQVPEIGQEPDYEAALQALGH